APGLPILGPPGALHALDRVPVDLARADDLGGRHRHAGPAREPPALLPAPGEPRPDDAPGEVLGHVPLPDLLAARNARVVAGAFGLGAGKALRGGQNRSRKPLIDAARRAGAWPARDRSPTLSFPERTQRNGPAPPRPP